MSCLGEQMKLEMLNSEQPYQNLKPLPDGRSERCRPQAGRPETGWNHKGDCAAPRDLITDPREERPRVDQDLLLEHYKIPQNPPPDTRPFIYFNILFYLSIYLAALVLICRCGIAPTSDGILLVAQSLTSCGAKAQLLLGCEILDSPPGIKPTSTAFQGGL
nr:PREDICTED: uncharacterized protein LOC109572850 [Bos indicus]